MPTSCFYERNRTRLDVIRVENDEDRNLLNKLSENSFPALLANLLRSKEYLLEHWLHRWKVASDMNRYLNRMRIRQVVKIYVFSILWTIERTKAKDGQNRRNVQGCTRLGWHRTSGESDLLWTIKEFGLILVGVIRRTVHTMIRIIMISVTERGDLHVKAHFSVCKATERWENKLFCVKRFFVNRLEEFE